mmetsp:Transcript_28000/g.65423  ORF Transcript_28000/g.65423 Transcript_28000/m.65423 type:complete len:262 (-) Transcript_28000:355-1140(-)
MLLACFYSARLGTVPLQTSSARWYCSSAIGSVVESLTSVRARLADAAVALPPRLVAVSKTKPVEALLEAYEGGHRDFGENYVQELISKAPQMPADCRWRFIGNLQSNKAKALVHGVPNLQCVETVDSAKLADRLQKAVAELEVPREKPLDIFLQVDTSPWEGTKSGVLPEEALPLARHIVHKCPLLRLAGLMTIGAAGDERCFEALRMCRSHVELSTGMSGLELSMGMSGDFEAATRAGSTSVRVGSSIFGAREYPAKPNP